MALYFMLHDAARFRGEVCPALAASWRQQDFGPCRRLCATLGTTMRSFGERYRIAPVESVIGQVAEGLSFHRDYWRSLVGEILLYGAEEIPEFQINPDTLCCLLAPEQYARDDVTRPEYAPIQQAHYGSRDLIFGTGYYRPEQAGYNDSADVIRLAEWLALVRLETWTVADLRALRDVEDDEERSEELDLTREWFPALRELYQGAHERGHLVVCEIL